MSATESPAHLELKLKEVEADALKSAVRKLPRVEALIEPDEAAGEVEEGNDFFHRYVLAA